MVNIFGNQAVRGRKVDRGPSGPRGQRGEKEMQDLLKICVCGCQLVY